MPQMAPMLWLILFSYFMLLLVFYVVLVYFVFTSEVSLKSSSTLLSVTSFNWLW